MQNHTKLSTISLDNLSTVTGGYHDPVDPPSPRRGDAPEPKGTLTAHLGTILNRFADLANQPAQK